MQQCVVAGTEDGKYVRVDWHDHRDTREVRADDVPALDIVPSQHSAAAQGICDKRLLVEAELHDPRPTDATSDPAEMGESAPTDTAKQKQVLCAGREGKLLERRALRRSHRTRDIRSSTVHAIAIGEAAFPLKRAESARASSTLSSCGRPLISSC